MTDARSARDRLLPPIACLTALIALAAFVSLNRDAQALREAFVLLGRLRAKYDPGVGEVGGAAARLLLTAAYPAAILLAAWRAGGALTGWLGLRDMDSWERLLIAPAVGLGLLAPAFLAVAVCGLVAAPLPAALVCLVIALGGSPPAGFPRPSGCRRRSAPPRSPGTCPAHSARNGSRTAGRTTSGCRTGSC